MIDLIEPESVYMIRHRKLRPVFFLYDCIDTDYLKLDTVLWTRIQYKAREFYTEESVETYMYEKLRSRPCEIILIK